MSETFLRSLVCIALSHVNIHKPELAILYLSLAHISKGDLVTSLRRKHSHLHHTYFYHSSLSSDMRTRIRMAHETSRVTGVVRHNKNAQRVVQVQMPTLRSCVSTLHLPKSDGDPTAGDRRSVHIPGRHPRDRQIPDGTPTQSGSSVTATDKGRNATKGAELCTSVSYRGLAHRGREGPSCRGCSTAEELRSVLGMVNYYGKFLPDLATTLAPLYLLLVRLLRNVGPAVLSRNSSSQAEDSGNVPNMGVTLLIYVVMNPLSWRRAQKFRFYPVCDRGQVTFCPFWIFFARTEAFS